MLSKTSEFTEFNGNFEILNISLGVPEICGQKRPVFRPREIGGSLKQSRLTRLSVDSERPCALTLLHMLLSSDKTKKVGPFDRFR